MALFGEFYKKFKNLVRGCQQLKKLIMQQQQLLFYLKALPNIFDEHFFLLKTIALILKSLSLKKAKKVVLA
jgi:hypothetical protein